ncbi:MAG: GntP family permease [Bacteroidales bacterium]
MNTLLISIVVLLSILAVIWLTSSLKLKAFVALFIVSLLLAVATLPAGKIVNTLKEGFGSTIASIGFLIIFGAMIGVILDKTGATISIADFILSRTGKKRSATALGITGFITGLPIFCDSGFIVLSGLAKSFSRRSGVVMPFMVTVLATSLYSVHCLIPPHPGATAAAGIMKTDIGHLIIFGTFFAIPGAISAFLWSRWIAKKGRYTACNNHEDFSLSANGNLPPVVLSFIPIVVPLLLITLRSVLSLFESLSDTFPVKILAVLGDPVVALFTGVMLALLLVNDKSINSFNNLFTEAIEKAGPILIVTAAGGTFGMVIKATGTGEAAGELLGRTGLGLVIPFIIAAILKTAQGSSTVAIITAASFTAPMLSALGLDTGTGRLLTMLSMGAGSMIVSHANDSYFWVVSNFSGIDTGTSLRIFSSSTAVMGTVVFIAVWIVSLFIL